MALINWSDSLAVKIAGIDQQHQQLIGIINDLNDAMKAGKGKEVLAGIVDRMITYTVTHFKLEEQYFDQYKYPDAAAHKRQHAQFIDKARELRDGVRDGNLSLSVEAMRFLGDWWTGHINGTDMKYAAFFAERGVR